MFSGKGVVCLVVCLVDTAELTLAGWGVVRGDSSGPLCGLLLFQAARGDAALCCLDIVTRGDTALCRGEDAALCCDSAVLCFLDIVMCGRAALCRGDDAALC
jgi:hypothetical protein